MRDALERGGGLHGGGINGQEVVAWDCTAGVVDVDLDGSWGDPTDGSTTEDCTEGDGSRVPEGKTEFPDPEGLTDRAPVDRGVSISSVVVDTFTSDVRELQVSCVDGSESVARALVDGCEGSSASECSFADFVERSATKSKPSLLGFGV